MKYEKPSSAMHSLSGRLEDFDRASGNRVERLIFNHRPWVILLCLLATLVLGWQAASIGIKAS